MQPYVVAIADLDKVRLNAEVDETDIGRLNEGEDAFQARYDRGCQNNAPVFVIRKAVTRKAAKPACRQAETQRKDKAVQNPAHAFFLSFPQAKCVGNPSENKERFRTSRNDTLQTIDCIPILRQVLDLWYSPSVKGMC